MKILVPHQKCAIIPLENHRIGGLSHDQNIIIGGRCQSD